MSPAVAAAYATIALVACWLLIGARGGWRIKLAVIVAAPALALALWQASRVPAGWPTTVGPSKSAGFVWAVVDEPDPQTGDPGRIFLWLDVGQVRPRAFSLAYSRRLHVEVQRALDQTRHGQHVAVTRQRQGHGRGRGRGSSRSAHGFRLRMYVEPPAAQPRKHG